MKKIMRLVLKMIRGEMITNKVQGKAQARKIN